MYSQSQPCCLSTTQGLLAILNQTKSLSLLPHTSEVKSGFQSIWNTILWTLHHLVHYSHTTMSCYEVSDKQKYQHHQCTCTHNMQQWTRNNPWDSQINRETSHIWKCTDPVGGLAVTTHWVSVLLTCMRRKSYLSWFTSFRCSRRLWSASCSYLEQVPFSDRSHWACLMRATRALNCTILSRFADSAIFLWTFCFRCRVHWQNHIGELSGIGWEK